MAGGDEGGALPGRRWAKRTGYQEYIPLFVYFALYAYPEYEVIVYLEGTLHPEVDACLRACAPAASSDVDRFRTVTRRGTQPLRRDAVELDLQAVKAQRRRPARVSRTDTDPTSDS